MATIDEQIAEVRREIAFRERAYPKWVAEKRMSAEQAKRQIGVMQEVLRVLAFVKTVGIIERADFDGSSAVPPVAYIRHGKKLHRYERTTRDAPNQT